MAKTMQQLWDYAHSFLFFDGETKDFYIDIAYIMKYGVVRKLSLLCLFSINFSILVIFHCGNHKY